MTLTWHDTVTMQGLTNPLVGTSISEASILYVASDMTDKKAVIFANYKDTTWSLWLKKQQPNRKPARAAWPN
ncbi:Fc.00g036450.m01.CDS01 [Cosmosporella sp. VM-42]